MFLIDGRVAGTWKVDNGRMVYDEFRTLTRTERRRRDEEGERLADFHA